MSVHERDQPVDLLEHGSVPADNAGMIGAWNDVSHSARSYGPGRSCVLAIALLGAVLCSSISSAQTLAPSGLQAVDPSRADMGPLRTSFRVLQPDLRAPSGFDRVYRVPGSSTGVRAMSTPGAQSPELYARVSGGIAAVFPASEYIRDRKGNVHTVVPAGTVFYIGGVPESAPTPVVRRRSPLSVNEANDTAVSTWISPAIVRPVDDSSVATSPGRSWSYQTSAPTTHVQMRPGQSRTPMSVLSDEGYRRERTRRLLVAAAAKR